MNLDNFLHSDYRNLYIEEPGFEFLYVRKSKRFIEGEIISNVLDIANLEAKKKHTGTFKSLIARIQIRHPDITIFVESVLEPYFGAGLLKMGFIEVKGSFPPSYYLKAKAV